MSKPALVAFAAAVVTGAVAAYLFLDVVIAAATLIVGLTLVALTALVRDWDRHPTFEERELARSRRRATRWERNAGARAKDRARWEAHQARKAARQQSARD